MSETSLQEIATAFAAQHDIAPADWRLALENIHGVDCRIEDGGTEVSFNHLLSRPAAVAASDEDDDDKSNDAGEQDATVDASDKDDDNSNDDAGEQDATAAASDDDDNNSNDDAGEQDTDAGLDRIVSTLGVYEQVCATMLATSYRDLFLRGIPAAAAAVIIQQQQQQQQQPEELDASEDTGAVVLRLYMPHLFMTNFDADESLLVPFRYLNIVSSDPPPTPCCTVRVGPGRTVYRRVYDVSMVLGHAGRCLPKTEVITLGCPSYFDGEYLEETLLAPVVEAANATDDNTAVSGSTAFPSLERFVAPFVDRCVSPRSWKALVSVLALMPNLNEVWIGRYAGEGGESQTLESMPAPIDEAYLKALCQSKTLERLRISCSGMNDTHMEALKDGLLANESITFVQLDGCTDLTEKGWRSLYQLMEQQYRIRRFCVDVRPYESVKIRDVGRTIDAAFDKSRDEHRRCLVGGGKLPGPRGSPCNQLLNKIQTLCELNRSGRGRVVGNPNASPKDLVDLLVKARKVPDVASSVLKLNPTMFCAMAAAAAKKTAPRPPSSRHTRSNNNNNNNGDDIDQKPRAKKRRRVSK